jgi:malate/lactate dehydrogenase
VHDWHFGTLPSEHVSMGVVSDGSYGVPKGLVFSFPVECKQGSWKIVQGLNWEDWQKKLVENTTKELLEEKQMALEALK